MPEETEDVIVPESSPEEVVEPASAEPTEPAPKAEKMVPYSRFKEVNDKLKELKDRPVQASASLDVNEIIAINASLEGLTQREKEKLAEEHRLTGRPLAEIRKSEDFLLWQHGYQQKVEKERALKPSSAQPEAETSRKLSEVLSDPRVPRAEKEELMKKHGLYKEHGAPQSYRKVLMP